MTEAASHTAADLPALTAEGFCRLLADLYRDKPDDQALSIGTWHYPEPDPAKMTVHTLPEFNGDMSVTVGELRRMVGVPTT